MYHSTIQSSVSIFHSFLSVLFQCGTVGDNGPGGNLTERSLQDAQRLFLMSEVVQPISVDPLISQDNIRFSKLVVDIVQGRDTLYHVIYIGTGETCLSTNLHGWRCTIIMLIRYIQDNNMRH